MSRRVATITLNPAYDLVGFCPEIERGEVNLVKPRVCTRRAKALTLPRC
ncbi:1-phosphofructokinase [Salmonella enterica subsp. enterica]|uniref:1-phosphofructokinase n=1 Tax=Salmonella enterica I TaxID=59201 RepID=A0A379W6B9_SALET|nr:1-phosphofructokinase [Salmonella enterica subsp. enterica]